jgi:hypothetical protein
VKLRVDKPCDMKMKMTRKLYTIQSMDGAQKQLMRWRALSRDELDLQLAAVQAANNKLVARRNFQVLDHANYWAHASANFCQHFKQPDTNNDA